MEKYMIFECAEAGFNNIRMLLETAICVAHLTSRVLVLPPRIICKHFNPVYPHQTKIKIQEFFDFKYLTRYIKIISYNTFRKSFPDIITRLNLQRVAEIENDKGFKSYRDWKGIIDYAVQFRYNFNGGIAYYFGEIKNSDFSYFRTNRQMIHFAPNHSVYCDPLICFSRENFGLFYTVIYGNCRQQWVHLLKIINDGLRLKDKFYTEVDQMRKICLSNNYNAIHLRRGDFLTCHESYARTVASNNQAMIKCKQEFINKIKTIYVSTNDMEDKFDDLKTEYNIMTWNDIKHVFKIDDHLIPIYEMIICSKADSFIGSYLSTFTACIHRLRGTSKYVENKRLAWFTHSNNTKLYPSWSGLNDLWAREFVECWMVKV